MRKYLVLLAFILLSTHIAQSLDVSVHILEKYRVINPGEDLQFQVTLKNIEQVGRRDISLEYLVYKGEELISKSKELKAVETQASFLSRINIPEDSSPGSYLLKTIINSNQIAEDTFRVNSKSNPLTNLKYYMIILSIVVLFVGTMIWWEVHKVYKLEMKRKGK